MYIMCGVPGCGKSTFVKNLISKAQEENNDNSMFWVSRDEIRYSLFGGAENVTLDNYYSKENQVRANFYEIINKGLMAGCNVFADATHLTPASRKSLLKRIYAKHKYTVAIVMNTPLPVCLERNSTREGVKNVPAETIRDMWKNFQMPTFDEGFNKIIVVNEAGEIENTYESEE